jgi:hypothetical protein
MSQARQVPRENEFQSSFWTRKIENSSDTAFLDWRKVDSLVSMHATVNVATPPKETKRASKFFDFRINCVPLVTEEKG